MAFLRKLLTRPGRAKSTTFTGYRPVGVAAPLGEADTSLAARVGAYGRNELVFTCVDIRATSAADARLIVQARDAEGNWVEAAGHPLRRLIMRPNRKMDEAAFIRAAIASYDVAGVFYCEVVRAPAGNPLELHPLNPAKVKPVYRDEQDGSRTLTGYEWKDGRYKKAIPLEDMLVRRGGDVLLDQARLGRAMGAVDLDNLQTDFTRAFFKNGGIPSGILKYHRRLTDEQKDLIRLQWRARYNMPWGNPQDVAVLDDEQEYQRVGVGLNELENAILRAVSETRICTVFKVSPMIIYAYTGMERATYNNLQESWKQFWQSTMSPLLRDWRAWLQTSLLTEFHEEERVLAEEIRLWWDLSAVAALKEDVDGLHTRAREDFRAGGITLDEFRAAIGFDPYPDEAVGETNPYLLQLLARVNALNRPALPAGDEDDEEAETASRLPRLEMLAGRNGRLGKLARARLATGRATPLPHGTPEEVVAWNKAQRDEEAVYLDAYGADVRELVEQALEGKLERETFVAELRALSADWLVLLFLAGALFPHAALAGEEEAALAEHLVVAREEAATFGDDLYAGRYGGAHGDGTADVDERVGLWVAAGATVLTMGRTFRADDPALMWVRGGDDTCADCLAHHGMVMRASEWRRYSLRPKSQGLACSGHRCGCDLYEVSAGE